MLSNFHFHELLYSRSLVSFITSDFSGLLYSKLLEICSLSTLDWIFLLVRVLAYCYVGFWCFMLFFPTVATIIFFWPNVIRWHFFGKPLRTTKRKIKLRKILSKPSELAEFKTDNPLIAEFVQMGDRRAQTIDFCVMKYLGEEVPLVQKQEHQHAMNNLKTFTEYNKKDEMKRWNWILFLEDWLYLRTGEKFGAALATHVETMGPVQFFSVVEEWGEQASGMQHYHALEECEHAAVTVHNIKKKTNLVNLYFAGIIKNMVDSALFGYLPFALLIGNPTLIFDPLTIIKCHLSFLSLMGTIMKNMEDAQAQVWHPQPLEPARYERFMKITEEAIVKKGIKFEIVEEAEYEIDICVEDKKRA